MTNRFFISENDRRNILSMHKLLLESTNFNVTIKGIVKNSSNDPIEYATVKITDENDKIISGVGSVTDIDGKFTITTNLPEGKYKVTAKETKNSGYSEINVTKDEEIEIDILISKIKEIEEVPVLSGSKSMPLFNINVLDTSNNKIDGAEIKLFYNEQEITYGLYQYTDNGFTIDNTTKKTKNGLLKNIGIDINKYNEFNPGNTPLCEKKLPITVVVDYSGNNKTNVFEICLNNAFYTLNRETGEPNYNIAFKLKQEQVFDITLSLHNSIILRVVDSKTKEGVGPGTVDIYHDIQKTEYVGKIDINDSGFGSAYIGSNEFGAIKVSNNKNEIKTKKLGEQDLYLYSFEKGYDEFFKKYKVDINGLGTTIPLDVEIDYYDAEDDDEKEENWFDKKSTRRIIYGKSERKFKTEKEAINDAKQNALEQYLNRSKKFKDNEQLRGQTPDGGQVVLLHNYDDGTYYAVVKYKRRELKNYAKKFIPKEEPKKEEPKNNINYSDFTIEEALNNFSDKNVFVFAISDSTASKGLINEITSDDILLKIINNNYINLYVPNDSSNANYKELINKYNLETFPTVILFIETKPYYFNNYKGSIYLQLKNYFGL